MTLKICGKEVWKGVVWSVWAAINPTIKNPATPGNAGGVFSVTTRTDFPVAVHPDTICSDDDRPDIEAQAAVDVPGANNHDVVYNALLRGGATRCWDVSRRLRVKVLNPNLIPLAQLPAMAGPVWAGQPAAMTIPADYPASDVEGNGDSTVANENDNPYTSGAMLSWNTPTISMANASGANGNTFEVRLQFGEFVRLQLGGTWYRVSDIYDWRFHVLMRRVGGHWGDNGSVTALDNAGW